MHAPTRSWKGMDCAINILLPPPPPPPKFGALKTPPRNTVKCVFAAKMTEGARNYPLEIEFYPPPGNVVSSNTPKGPSRSSPSGNVQIPTLPLEIPQDMHQGLSMGGHGYSLKLPIAHHLFPMLSQLPLLLTCRIHVY